MRNLNRCLQRDGVALIRLDKISDCGCILADSLFQSHLGAAVFVPYRYEFTSRNRKRTIIAVVLDRLKNDFVLESGGIWKLCAFVRIVPCHDRGWCQDECGIASSSDIRVFNPQLLSDELSRFFEQFFHFDVTFIRLAHCISDGCRRCGSPSDGLVTGRINDGSRAEFFVDVSPTCIRHE